MDWKNPLERKADKKLCKNSKDPSKKLSQVNKIP